MFDWLVGLMVRLRLAFYGVGVGGVLVLVRWLGLWLTDRLMCRLVLVVIALAMLPAARLLGLQLGLLALQRAQVLVCAECADEVRRLVLARLAAA